MSSIVFFENQFVPLSEAKINIMTHAFLYGTAIFEGIRGYWSARENNVYLFRPKEHFQRLRANGKILHMHLPQSSEELVSLAIELLKLNKWQEDVYIRPTVYKAGLRIGPCLSDNPDAFCMVSLPLGDYIDTERGISTTVSGWRRLEDNAIPPRAKIAGSYVNTALAKTDAVKAGFTDAIVLDERGHVSEGSAMNIFLVREGRLITTPINDNILEGITRDSVIKIAQQEMGINVETRSIDRTELYIADELFFCGTGAQVSPITSVDWRPVGNGHIGSITRQIQELYFKVVRGEIPRYREWCVPVDV